MSIPAVLAEDDGKGNIWGKVCPGRGDAVGLGRMSWEHHGMDLMNAAYVGFAGVIAANGQG